MQYIVFPVGETGQHFRQLFPFHAAFRMARIDADDEHAHRLQEVQRALHRRAGGLPAGGYRMVPARQPAQVEDNCPRRLLHEFRHPLMAGKDQFRPAGERGFSIAIIKNNQNTSFIVRIMHSPVFIYYENTSYPVFYQNEER